MTFGQCLKMLRLQNDLTQTALANKLNLSKANISKYENGSIEPNLETVGLISKIFNVPTDYLLGITNDLQLPSDTNFGQANIPTPEAELPAVIMQYGKSGQSFVYKKHESENFQELMQLIESFPEDKIKAILEIVKMMK